MRRNKKRERLARQPQKSKVADLAQARSRRQKQKIRKMLLWVVPLTLLFVWFVGRNSAALVSAGDFVETLRIGMVKGQGYPQNTGITELYQWKRMNGGFVALGQESCVFYTDKGVKMRSIQAGYARPAISAGDTRFVLYNRGGTELRVEGRSKNLYTQSYTGGILLCEMGADGSLAVVTEDPSYTAQMQVYPNSMENPLTWKMTAKEGMPLRMAFSPSEKQLAVATLSAVNGETVSNLYVLDRAKKQETLVDTRTGNIPLAVEWVGDTLLVAYNDSVVAYQGKKGAVAEFALSGQVLTDYSLMPNGRMALLLTSGSTSDIVLLDKTLKETCRITVEAGNKVVLTKTGVYLCTDSNVVCYSLEGLYAWHKSGDMRPQGLLQTKAGLLEFRGGVVEKCTNPNPE